MRLARFPHVDHGHADVLGLLSVTFLTLRHTQRQPSNPCNTRESIEGTLPNSGGGASIPGGRHTDMGAHSLQLAMHPHVGTSARQADGTSGSTSHHLPFVITVPMFRCLAEPAVPPPRRQRKALYVSGGGSKEQRTHRRLIRSELSYSTIGDRSLKVTHRIP